MKVGPHRSLAVTIFAAVLIAACGTHPATFDQADAGGSQGSSGDAAPAGGGSSGGASGGDSGFKFGGSSSGGGSSGGSVTGCDASCVTAGGTCKSGVCTITENPGNVSTATQTKLQGSGTSDSAFAWLYPYDKTVFPRGLLSPTLQFGGAASDSEYVHITSKTLDYQGYFAGGTAGKVALSLSQKAWTAVTAAVGAGDSARVQVHQDLRGAACHGTDHRVLADRPGQHPRHRLLPQRTLRVDESPSGQQLGRHP